MESLFSCKQLNVPLLLGQIPNSLTYLAPCVFNSAFLSGFITPYSQSYSAVHSSLMCPISQDSTPIHMWFSLPAFCSCSFHLTDLGSTSPASFTWLPWCEHRTESHGTSDLTLILTAWIWHGCFLSIPLEGVLLEGWNCSFLSPGSSTLPVTY